MSEGTVRIFPPDSGPVPSIVRHMTPEQAWAYGHQCGWASAQPGATPIDMVLHCPACHHQHIDAPETDEQYNGRLFESSWWECGGDKPERWTNPVHRSHKCQHCDFIWRPADVPTNGVEHVLTKGKNDS